jgi:hypothetical protein
VDAVILTHAATFTNLGDQLLAFSAGDDEADCKDARRTSYNLQLARPSRLYNRPRCARGARLHTAKCDMVIEVRESFGMREDVKMTAMTALN